MWLQGQFPPDNPWSHWQTSAKPGRVSRTKSVPVSLWGSGGEIEEEEPQGCPSGTGRAEWQHHWYHFLGSSNLLMGIPACKFQHHLLILEANSGLIWKDAQNQPATREVCLAENPCRKLHSNTAGTSTSSAAYFSLCFSAVGEDQAVASLFLALFFGTTTQLDHSRINTHQIIQILFSFPLKGTKFISWWCVPLRDNSHYTMKFVVSSKTDFKCYNTYLWYHFNNGNYARLPLSSLTKKSRSK